MRHWTPGFFLFLLMVSGVARSQEAFRATQGVSLETSRMTSGGILELFFTHRFSETIADSELNNLYGLDSFAFTGFGLAYGLKDYLTVGLYRTANEKNFEGWVRWGILRKENTSLSLRGSFNFNTDKGTNDPFRGGIMAIAGVQLGRIDFSLSPSVVTHPARFEANDDPTLALNIALAFRLSERLSLIGEVAPVLAGYKKQGLDDRYHPTWGAGVQIEVGEGGHVFHLLLTNQSGTTLDQVLPGADTGSLRLGFNLLRRF